LHGSGSGHSKKVVRQHVGDGSGVSFPSRFIEPLVERDQLLFDRTLTLRCRGAR
jgi:hypothetical protein